MSDWQKQVVCRYFVLGSCKNGASCLYSHNPDLIPQSTGFAQVPEFVDAYYEDYVGDEALDFSEGYPQEAAGYGTGADHSLEQYPSEVYSCEYGPVDGEILTGVVEEDGCMHADDPGGGVNTEMGGGNNELEVAPNSCFDHSCQIQGLSVGVNTMSLDACSDPNCLDNSQTLIEAQDFNPSSVYPTSPTYIVYTPVYQSPALSPATGPLMSPSPPGHPQPISIVTTSPGGVGGLGNVALSPGSGVMQTAVLSPTGMGGLMMQMPHMHPPHPLVGGHSPSHNLHTQVGGPSGATTTLVSPTGDKNCVPRSVLSSSATITPLTSPIPSVIKKVSPAIKLNPETAEWSPTKKEILKKAAAIATAEKSITKSTTTLTPTSLSTTQQQNETSLNAEASPNSTGTDKIANTSQSSTGSADNWRVPTNWAEAPVFTPGTFAKQGPSLSSTSSGVSYVQLQKRSKISVQQLSSVPSRNDTKQQVEEDGQPKQRSWAQVVNSNIVKQPSGNLTVSEAESQLCPYFRVGECRYGDICMYIHGVMCDYCGQNILHPQQDNQRKAHLGECLQEHERDMELSFAVARSKEKTCGICMEIVLDKPKGEARFGILPSCNHCFCLPCIRKWRQAKQFEHKIIRACPECRQTSDFICPSRFWVETTEQKEQLLTEYKKNLGLKECKYFNKGSGECPFGNKCFYQHADKDGRVVDVGPPRKPQRRVNAEGNLSLVQRLLLYDFLEEREGQLVLPLDFVELFDLYSDSEDWSENEP